MTQVFDTLLFRQNVSPPRLVEMVPHEESAHGHPHLLIGPLHAHVPPTEEQMRTEQGYRQINTSLFYL